MYDKILQQFYLFLPAILVISFAILIGWLISFFISKKRSALRNSRFHRQILLLCLGSVTIIVFILVLPLKDAIQNQLLGIMGLLLTAIIGLSSTTFASNAMAGLMLKLVKNFRKGDFIRVDRHFGRVTERGLFHTEIQTPESNLITIPNHVLITQPTTTTRQTGTIVSASISLGYDVHHEKIIPLLLKAAEDTKLREPFVRITKLGDFSISYRISGILDEIKTLITSESTLRKNMLQSLHLNHVEIVSPTFMNQKILDKNASTIPSFHQQQKPDSKVQPETIMFAKADQAELIDKLESGLQSLLDDIEQNEGAIKELEGEEKLSAEQNLQNKKLQYDNLSNKIGKLLD